MSRYAKAIAALLTALATALADGQLTAAEVCLTLAAGLTVYAVPNRPPAGQAADPAVSELGLTLIEACLLVLFVLVLLLLLGVLPTFR